MWWWYEMNGMIGTETVNRMKRASRSVCESLLMKIDDGCRLEQYLTLWRQ